MIAFIIGLVLGAVGASVGWFFVIRNNKARFDAALALASKK
jgi:hypothetical protein